MAGRGLHAVGPDLCSGTLTGGPAFGIVTAATGASATLSVGRAAAQTPTQFPIGGIMTTGYAGLPQAGWWHEPASGTAVGPTRMTFHGADRAHIALPGGRTANLVRSRFWRGWAM